MKMISVVDFYKMCFSFLSELQISVDYPLFLHSAKTLYHTRMNFAIDEEFPADISCYTTVVSGRPVNDILLYPYYLVMSYVNSDSHSTGYNFVGFESYLEAIACMYTTNKSSSINQMLIQLNEDNQYVKVSVDKMPNFINVSKLGDVVHKVLSSNKKSMKVGTLVEEWTTFSSISYVYIKGDEFYATLNSPVEFKSLLKTKKIPIHKYYFIVKDYYPTNQDGTYCRIFRINGYDDLSSCYDKYYDLCSLYNSGNGNPIALLLKLNKSGNYEMVQTKPFQFKPILTFNEFCALVNETMGDKQVYLNDSNVLTDTEFFTPDMRWYMIDVSKDVKTAYKFASHDERRESNQLAIKEKLFPLWSAQLPTVSLYKKDDLYCISSSLVDMERVHALPLYNYYLLSVTPVVKDIEDIVFHLKGFSSIQDLKSYIDTEYSKYLNKCYPTDLQIFEGYCTVLSLVQLPDASFKYCNTHRYKVRYTGKGASLFDLKEITSAGNFVTSYV